MNDRDARFEALFRRLDRRIDELGTMPPPYSRRQLTLHATAIFLAGILAGAFLRGLL